MMPSIQPPGLKEEVVEVDDDLMHKDCVITENKYFHDANCMYPYRQDVSEREMKDANDFIQYDGCMPLSNTTESSMFCYGRDSIIYNFYQASPMADCSGPRSTSWDK